MVIPDAYDAPAVPQRRVPFRGPLRQGLQANAFEFRRNGFVDLSGWASLVARYLFKQFVERIRLEGTPAGEQFVKANPRTDALGDRSRNTPPAV
jgi:hypothetical protein